MNTYFPDRDSKYQFHTFLATHGAALGCTLFPTPCCLTTSPGPNPVQLRPVHVLYVIFPKHLPPPQYNETTPTLLALELEGMSAQFYHSLRSRSTATS